MVLSLLVAMVMVLLAAHMSKEEPMVAQEPIPALDLAATPAVQEKPVAVREAPQAAQAQTVAVQPVVVDGPAEEDVDLLARLIACEMGASWVTDEQQRYVGSVVLNRIASPLFPDTLREVIYEPGQYAPAINGIIETAEPDERTRENARWLLENGSILPEDVVFQSEMIQGPIYDTYYDEVLGSTTYYCYAN